MQSRNFIVFTMACILFPALVFAGENKMEVMDARGKKIVLRTPIKSVVVLTTDGIEVLRTLGVGDLIVGASSLIWKEPELWPELQNVANVGKWNDPDPEAIVRLMPDLVLCYGHNPGSSLEEKVGGLGIQILRIDCFRPSTIKGEIRTLGMIFGRDEKAQEFLAWLEAHEKAVLDCFDHSGKPIVAYMEAYSDFKASGTGTAMHELCKLAGGYNIAETTDLQNPEVTTEWVLSMAPDAVIKAGSIKRAYSTDSDQEIRDLYTHILNRPGFNQLPAVKNGQFHILAGDIGPGPRYVVGLAYMAKWFHPSSCGGLDPAAMHKEYMERFQGLPLKGYYVFPE